MGEVYLDPATKSSSLHECAEPFPFELPFDERAHLPDLSQKKRLDCQAKVLSSDATPKVSSAVSDQLPQKPVLEPPSSFVLAFLMGAMGVLSEALSHFNDKQEIESVREEREKTHQELIGKMKKACDQEKYVHHWGVAFKLFSWLTSTASLFAGLVLMATGVGTVGGALLFFGGLISLGNQIMQETHGWQKVAELLPGDDEQKKQATVMWMQIGIGVFCLILAGAGIVYGGFAAYGQASGAAMALFGSTITTAVGVCSIGRAVTEYLYYNRMADSKKLETRLIALEHQQDDLSEQVKTDFVKNYFELISKVFGFLRQINHSHQRAWR